MKYLYNTFSYLFEVILPLLQHISPKMKLFVSGRKQTKKLLQAKEFSGEWLWFHCASLGEFEQAVPLIEKLKSNAHKILVTFFSPSGYENKKNHKLIDLALYLPIDTPKNAELFISKFNIKAAFFIKYDFWENYFKLLNAKQIPVYMVSSTFRSNQFYFKWYGSFFKNTLKRVTHFFVQNKKSLKVLQQNGFTNVSVSGDTRFDRVNAQLTMNNQLDFIEDFIANRLCIVLGSTWGECEDAFINTINSDQNNTCYIIAPHEIKAEKIKALQNKLKIKTSISSKGIQPKSKVLIVDAIGYLTKIYSYADIAYVGGAMGTTGLHNILEPAVFGMPILTGPNVEKFPEAKALENAGGLIIINNDKEFNSTLKNLIEDNAKRKQMAQASVNFVQSRVGATKTIISYLEENANFY